MGMSLSDWSVDAKDRSSIVGEEEGSEGRFAVSMWSGSRIMSLMPVAYLEPAPPAQSRGLR